MTDTRISKQAFHIGLHYCQQRAVKDANHSQNFEKWSKRMRCAGEERYAVAQETKSSCLCHRPGQHSCHRSWRFTISIWQPAMERYKRHLDDESGSKRQK